MKNTTKKNLLGYMAVALVLTMVIGVSFAVGRTNGNASAEVVTVSENATVVSSPFTEAVSKVRDSVVGVNNYTTASNSSYYSYGFGYGFGYGNGNGNNGLGGNKNGSSEPVLQSRGSGVVVANGYVLTNYHVVEGASSLEIVVSNDGADDTTYAATVVASDENADLAVLKADGLPLAPVTLGDSDVLNVGDWAIIIGNPLSFTKSTTVGVISALNREVSSSSYDSYGLKQEVVNSMLQTDAAINAGNSGGGMFNVAGELIGVPSMKYTSSYYSSTSIDGIGMAIPVNVAKPLIESAINGTASTTSSDSSADTTVNTTTSSKPRIGVTVTNATNFSSYAVQEGLIPSGAYVTDVESGSPADQAGIQVGDIIVEADGTVITSTSQLISILQAKNAGDSAAVKLWRSEGIADATTINDIKEGTYMDVTVTLAMLDNVKQ